MKNMLFAAFALLASVSIAQASPTQTPKDPSPFYIDQYKLFGNKKATLAAGSTIQLELNEQLSTESLTIGNLVQFRVIANVMAEGDVAVQTGAHAMGRVKTIQPATHNNPEEIKIELLFVTAVDGQTVALNGDEQHFRGQFSGEAASVEIGRKITTRVANDTEIKVK